MTRYASTITIVIGERDQPRTRAAVSRMPYAATERVPKPWVAMGDTADAEAVEAVLDGLAEVQAEVTAEKDKHRHSLFSLETRRRDVPPPHRHRTPPR